MNRARAVIFPQVQLGDNEVLPKLRQPCTPRAILSCPSPQACREWRSPRHLPPEYVGMQSPPKPHCWGGELSLKAACSHKLEVVQGLAPPTPSLISDGPRLPAQLEFLHLKSEEFGPPDL